jgi:hypothetical protein
MMIAYGIHGDLKEPRRKTLHIADLIELGKTLDQGIVDDILGVMVVMHPAPHKTEQARAKLAPRPMINSCQHWQFVPQLQVQVHVHELLPPQLQVVVLISDSKNLMGK